MCRFPVCEVEHSKAISVQKSVMYPLVLAPAQGLNFWVTEQAVVTLFRSIVPSVMNLIMFTEQN